jgi:hypothetical protein
LLKVTLTFFSCLRVLNSGIGHDFLILRIGVNLQTTNL